MTTTSSKLDSSSAGHTLWTIASAGSLLLGLAMRWHGLARFGFEQDELYTLQESRELFATSIRPGIDARPLYYLLHHVVTPLLPNTEFGARLPAFFFGLVGLFLTWRLGKYLAGDSGGFLALTLAVFSPWHLFVSGEARYWPLVYCLSVAAILALLRARDSVRWRDHLLAGLLLTLGALTHPTFIFTFAGVVPSLLFRATENGFRFQLPSRQTFLGTWMLTGIVVAGNAAILHFTGRGSTLSNWSGRGLGATLQLLPAMVQLAGATIVAAAAIGIYAGLCWGSIRARQAALMALAGGCSGTLLLLLASLRTDVYADYGVSMLPLAFAAICCLLLSLDSIRPVLATASMAAILVAATLPETVSQLIDGMRFDYRPAYQWIKDHGVEEPTLVWPLIMQLHYGPELKASEFKTDVHQLTLAQQAGEPFWVIASVKRQGLIGDPGGVVLAWLNSQCRAELTTEQNRLDYRMYRVILYHCTPAVARSAP